MFATRGDGSVLRNSVRNHSTNSEEKIETIMKKVKITVLRATFNEDLALEYGMPGLKPCP